MLLVSCLRWLFHIAAVCRWCYFMLFLTRGDKRYYILYCYLLLLHVSLNLSVVLYGIAFLFRLFNLFCTNTGVIDNIGYPIPKYRNTDIECLGQDGTKKPRYRKTWDRLKNRQISNYPVPCTPLLTLVVRWVFFYIPPKIKPITK